ncbi:MAG: DNA-processing protein DprA [Micavibrio sp.]|nr:DNA-processing protein DprA [Micavibrio sp.]
MLQTKPQNEPLSQDDKLGWLRLSRSDNVGPITFYRLIERFGSAERALQALPDMAAKGGKKGFKAPDAAHVQAEYEALKNMGGEIVTAACEHYPLALSAIDDAPPVLSYFGDITLANKNCVAIVGARNASINGKKFASRLAKDLGQRDQVIVSGLARGIDTAAHQGALESGTIAVVAGGIDMIYPQENSDLFHAIKERGLIFAESALGTEPKAHFFPRRNRIVSGLSKATICMEATLKSGSLITARMAGEQGRDVMAVPGSPLDPRAQGPNHLIREGATLVRDANDVLEIIQNFSGIGFREPIFEGQLYSGPVAVDDNIPENASEDILALLSFTPIAVDELLRNCQLSIPALQTVLLELELAGRIQRLTGNRIVLLDQ